MHACCSCAPKYCAGLTTCTRDLALQAPTHVLTPLPAALHLLCCVQSSIMADDFTMSEEGGSKTYSKRGECQGRVASYICCCSPVHYMPRWGVRGVLAHCAAKLRPGACVLGCKVDNAGFRLLVPMAHPHATPCASSMVTSLPGSCVTASPAFRLLGHLWCCAGGHS
jgi:hypothetical protein